MGRASTLLVQLSRVGRAREGFPSTTEDAATEGSKHQTQQPDKAILHLNILVLPLQVDFGSMKTPVGLQVHISKLPSSSVSPKALLGERLLEVFCLGFRAFSQFFLKTKTLLVLQAELTALCRGWRSRFRDWEAQSQWPVQV